jgi:hypothetical protein
MAELPAYPPDAAICRLLALGPAPTAALAARLAVPERTVRHRLYRLRQAGMVVTGPDGLHRLAAAVPPALAAGSLSAPAAFGVAPALPAADLAAGRSPALAVAAVAPDHPVDDGPFPRQGGYKRARTVLATAVIGLAVAGAIAVMVRRRRMSAPPQPAPPSGFGNASDPWGSIRGPTW